MEQAAHRSTQGFVLLVLLIFLAIMGLVAAEGLHIGDVAQRRAAEHQLMIVGLTYRRALSAYATATPAGTSPYPHSIADLVRDPRYAEPHRYLRDAYPDPMTASGTWGFVPAPGGGFAGVFSTSSAHPIKKSGFSDDVKFFEDADSYQDWIFTSLDPNVVRQALGRFRAITGAAIDNSKNQSGAEPAPTETSD